MQGLVCVLLAMAAAHAADQAGGGRTAAQSGAGRIAGQVRLVLPPASAGPSGVYPSRRVTGPQSRAAEISNVIVYLKDVARHGEPAPMHATIEQKDEAFVPRVLAITRGSTIDFPNGD